MGEEKDIINSSYKMSNINKNNIGKQEIYELVKTERKIKDDISQILNNFHVKAALSNYDAYFDCFSKAQSGARFLGSDKRENWTVTNYRKYAKDFFENNEGLLYVPT